MYDMELYESVLKPDALGSIELEGKESLWSAASMLEVVGVCAIICCC
jgi:hypothetical protein